MFHLAEPSKRPVKERMLAAIEKQRMRRTPRVFFLNRPDWEEFVATNPPEGEFSFYQGGRPSTLTCYAFEGLAVRQSKRREDTLRGNSKQIASSQLFCCIGTSVSVPPR